MGINFSRFALTAVMGIGLPGFVWAQPLLLQTHEKALGQNCQVCHQENPPSKKVGDPTCVQCHGDRNALGARSKSKPNPHSNHVDELYCSDCHHIHKKSELYCVECHEDMKLQVP